jgi:hypothetical protein
MVAFGVTWAGLLLLMFNITVAVPRISHDEVDFPLWYTAGWISRTWGTAHLYDFALQARVTGDLLGHPYPNPFVSPPPLAWLALPLTLLPYPAAFALWLAALMLALGGAWYLAAPGAGLTRWAALAMAAGLFPVAFGVMLGAVSAFGALIVIVAWRLVGSGRPLAGGLMLSLLAIKPQLGLLVAPALLVAGRWRVFAGWVAGSGVLVAASLLALGSQGLAGELEALRVAGSWELSRHFTLAALAVGPWLHPAQALCGGLALAAAWRTRRWGIELPIAAGILGSLLVSPYLSLQDYTMLLPAGWLVWRAGAPVWLLALTLLAAIPLELALSWGPVPILLVELAWLAALVALPERRAAGEVFQTIPSSHRASSDMRSGVQGGS